MIISSGGHDHLDAIFANNIYNMLDANVTKQNCCLHSADHEQTACLFVDLQRLSHVNGPMGRFTPVKLTFITQGQRQSVLR